MARTKISITIPEEILDEMKKIAAVRDIKLSHLVAEALSEKIRKDRAETLLSKINKVFDDPGSREEQRRMAEDIANHADIRELPW